MNYTVEIDTNMYSLLDLAAENDNFANTLLHFDKCST